MEGADWLRRMWNIRLPCIKATIAILFILGNGVIFNHWYPWSSDSPGDKFIFLR